MACENVRLGQRRLERFCHLLLHFIFRFIHFFKPDCQHSERDIDGAVGYLKSLLRNDTAPDCGWVDWRSLRLGPRRRRMMTWNTPWDLGGYNLIIFYTSRSEAPSCRLVPALYLAPKVELIVKRLSFRLLG